MLDKEEAIKGQAQLELIWQRQREYGVLQSNGFGISSTGIEIEREQARNQGNVEKFAVRGSSA
jgi:hypothetical protein